MDEKQQPNDRSPLLGHQAGAIWRKRRKIKVREDPVCWCCCKEATCRWFLQSVWQFVAVLVGFGALIMAYGTGTEIGKLQGTYLLFASGCLYYGATGIWKQRQKEVAKQKKRQSRRWRLTMHSLYCLLRI